SLALAPRRARSPGSASSRATASRRAATSLGGTVTPVTPSCTMSRWPSVAVTTTALPIALASSSVVTPAWEPLGTRPTPTPTAPRGVRAAGPRGAGGSGPGVGRPGDGGGVAGAGGERAAGCDEDPGREARTGGGQRRVVAMLAPRRDDQRFLRDRLRAPESGV